MTLLGCRGAINHQHYGCCFFKAPFQSYSIVSIKASYYWPLIWWWSMGQECNVCALPDLDDICRRCRGRHMASRMTTSSNGNIFRVTSHLCGEFTGHRHSRCTKASDAELLCFFFDLRLNKRLSKQSLGWWFETPSNPLYWKVNLSFVIVALSSTAPCEVHLRSIEWTGIMKQTYWL